MNIPAVKHRAWAEIALELAEYNYKQIRKSTESKVCCVVKANAYGHGAVQLASLYQSLGADYLTVSNIEEALQLRYNNISLPILILGYTSCECAKLLSDYNITQCVFSHEYGIMLNNFAEKAGVKVKVHIKMDTGMGRIGFMCTNKDIINALEVCKQSNLYIEGIFTHFAAADMGLCGKEYTTEQFNSFMYAIKVFEESGVTFALKHCANSAAIFDYPEFHMDMVRAGIVLYGLAPSTLVKNLPDLKKVMSLHSVISHIKTVTENQAVSYGRTYVATEARTIATIPIGYADGFRRQNGQGKYSVLINKKPAPIVGCVCMDQLMVDVTEIECKTGDEVLVFGNENDFTVDRIAELNNTINYEIVCNVGERVPRAYIKNGKIIEWKDSVFSEI